MLEYMYEKMYQQEKSHWWFRTKREIVLALIQDYLKNKSGEISLLDAGCGCGYMLECLSQFGKTYGCDFSELAVSYSARNNKCKLKQIDLKNNVLLKKNNLMLLHV